MPLQDLLVAQKCGAKKRGKNECCMQPAMENGRCRLHGGKTPSGIASPHYKTGRYIKAMPARLSETFQQSISDTNQLELRSDVALIDARIEDMLSRVDTGESGEIWKALGLVAKEVQSCTARANKGDDKAALDREIAIEQMVTLCQEGLADYAAWKDVRSLLDQRRKLVDTETKRVIAVQELLSREQADAYTVALGHIIHANITDRTILSKITSEFRLLMAR